MSGKGSISRMSDECLMKQETVFSFCIVYQAVMRKFTLARKSFVVVIYHISQRFDLRSSLLTLGIQNQILPALANSQAS